jgi:excisionase family DNA binding protein
MTPPAKIKRGYSPKEIAELTGCALRTVQRKCADRLIPLYDPGNGHKGRRYDLDEALTALGYRDGKKRPGRPRKYERVGA